MNTSLQLALSLFFKFVSYERVLEVVATYLKAKVLPYAPEMLAKFIGDLAAEVFKAAPEAFAPKDAAK